MYMISIYYTVYRFVWSPVISVVCQNELLQSREETQKLLNKVEEMMQERSEMVTHRIHAQLLRISDARADEAEKRVQEVEKEVSLTRGF